MERLRALRASRDQAAVDAAARTCRGDGAGDGQPLTADAGGAGGTGDPRRGLGRASNRVRRVPTDPLGPPARLRAVDVAVVGGTGAEGFGLALRLARAGHRVTIGSRDAERGAGSATEATEAAGATLEGRTTRAPPPPPARTASSPSRSRSRGRPRSTARSRTPSHRAPSSWTRRARSRPQSAAGRGRRSAPGTARPPSRRDPRDGPRVVAGLHTIAAEALRALDHDVDSDVLLCADDPEAKARVGALIDGIPGMRWVDCGRLEMARVAEPLTALLVAINRAYKVKDSGFRIIGRDAWGAPS